MKKQIMIFTAGMLLLLPGCAGQQSTLEYIGADTAKAYALEAAGLTADQVNFAGTDMGSENGMDYYEVEFTANGNEYEYDVDALTGVIIDTKINGREVAPQAAAQVQQQAAATLPQSTPAPSQTTGTQQEAVPQSGTGQSTAAAQNNTAGQSTTGTQNNTAGQSTTGTQSTTTGQTERTAITEQRAKEIVLADAGVTESEVTFVRAYQDWDDGRHVYDVEFYTADYTEYDYELDIYTGAILTKDWDAEFYAAPAVTASAPATPAPAPAAATPAPAPSNTANASIISEAEAKAIVLAQVPGATDANIWEFYLERDDGRQEYDGTIIYNQMEYDFEVDAYSGAIRNWDVESIYD